MHSSSSQVAALFEKPTHRVVCLRPW